MQSFLFNHVLISSLSMFRCNLLSRMAVYMADLIEPPVPNSFAVNSASLALSVCLLFPVAGWLSDKVGRKRVMAIGGLGLAVLSPLMITMIGKGQASSAFFAQMILGISLSMWGAPMMAWLAESFDPAARLTSVSVGYNIGKSKNLPIIFVVFITEFLEFD